LIEETSQPFNGCVNVNGGLAVNAIADGNFFSIWDKSASFPLFEKNLSLYENCLPSTAERRRDTNSQHTSLRRLRQKRDKTQLSCPAAMSAAGRNLVSIVTAVVSGN